MACLANLGILGYNWIMSKTITISDEMAALLEERRRLEGQRTLDDAAEIAIARGLVANDDDDQADGLSAEELRVLIEEGRQSPAEPWDAAKFRAQVVSAYKDKMR